MQETARIFRCGTKELLQSDKRVGRRYFIQLFFFSLKVHLNSVLCLFMYRSVLEDYER